LAWLDENDAKLLKDITKDDVLSLFLFHVHPSSTIRAKLSVHMRSQKPRPKKVSAAAAQAFEVLVRGAALDVDETAWRDALGSDGNPSVTDFEMYWKGLLIDKEGGVDLLGAISGLVERYPVEGEGEDGVKAGAQYIEDLNIFRDGLAVSVDPGPMVQWGDLPVPRF
jgi:insulysin